VNLKGLKIAVTGIGVSGVAIAKAAKKRGALPTVYDQTIGGRLDQIETIDRLTSDEIPVITSWHGRLNEEDFDILITSPGFRKDHPAIQDALYQGKKVFSEVEFAWQISKAPMICITGTNGKSTCTVMTWQMLRSAGYDAVLCGNISGSGYPEITLTEAADYSKPNQVLVTEISSFQLEWIHDFKPRVASITNITPDHLNRYNGFEDYYNTKLNMFKNMSQGDSVIANLQESSLSIDTLLKVVPSTCQIYSYNELPENACDKRLKSLSIKLLGDKIDIAGQVLPMGQLPFWGAHNVANALQSLALVTAFIGQPSEKQILAMFDSLKNFKGLTYRLEVMGVKNDVLVINNSMCTNPKAVISSSQSIPKKQHLLMGGDAKLLNFTNVGEYLASTDHSVYLFGKDAPLMQEQLGKRWPIFESMDAAFESACENTIAGEVIMLAPGCASSFPFSNFRERGEHFRKIAQEWLTNSVVSESVLA
jgi:UDP-N-acetylmuramoylalanine--D-glutamate ligase